MENYQTCPCCNQDPRHKKILFDLLDYVLKQSKDIVAEIQLQGALSKSHLSEIDDMVEKGNLDGLLQLVDDESFLESLESQNKVVESKGMIDAYTKILQFLSTKI